MWIGTEFGPASQNSKARSASDPMLLQIETIVDSSSTHTAHHLFRTLFYVCIDVYLKTVGLGTDSGTVSVTARSLLNCRVTVSAEISRGCAPATRCN